MPAELHGISYHNNAQCRFFGMVCNIHSLSSKSFIYLFFLLKISSVHSWESFVALSFMDPDIYRDLWKY